MKIDLSNCPTNLIAITEINNLHCIEYSTKDHSGTNGDSYLTLSQMTVQLIQLIERFQTLDYLIYDYEVIYLQNSNLVELKVYCYVMKDEMVKDFKDFLNQLNDVKLFEIKHAELDQEQLKQVHVIDPNDPLVIEGLEGFLPPRAPNSPAKDIYQLLVGFLKAFRRFLNSKLCERGGVIFGDEIIQINWKPVNDPHSTWYFQGLPHNPEWPTLSNTSMKFQLWYHSYTLFLNISAQVNQARLIDWEDVKNIASESPSIQKDPLNPIINIESPVQALSSPNMTPVEILGFPFGLTGELESLILKRWCTILSLPNFDGSNNCQQPFKKSLPIIPNLTYIKFPNSNQPPILFPTFALSIPLSDGHHQPISANSKNTWNIAWDYTEIYFNMMEFILLNTNQNLQTSSSNNLRPMPKDTPHSNSMNSPQPLIAHPPTPSVIDYGRLGKELDTWDYLSSQFSSGEQSQTLNQPHHFTPPPQPLPTGNSSHHSEEFGFFNDLDLNNFNLGGNDPLHQDLNLGGLEGLDVTDDDFSYFDTKKETQLNQAKPIDISQSIDNIDALFNENSKDNNQLSTQNETNFNSIINQVELVQEPEELSNQEKSLKNSLEKLDRFNTKDPITSTFKLVYNPYPIYLSPQYSPLNQLNYNADLIKGKFNPLLNSSNRNKLNHLKPRNKLRGLYDPLYNPYQFYKLKKKPKEQLTETKCKCVDSNECNGDCKPKRFKGKVPEMVKQLVDLNNSTLVKPIQSSTKLTEIQNDEKEEGEAGDDSPSNPVESTFEKLLPPINLFSKPIAPPLPWVHYGNGMFEDDFILQTFIEQVQHFPQYPKSGTTQDEPFSEVCPTTPEGQHYYLWVLSCSEILGKVFSNFSPQKSNIKSFLSLKNYSNLIQPYKLRENQPTIVPSEEPFLRLGYHSDWISVKPSATWFWDRLELGPMGPGKNIQYLCMLPSNRDLILECNNFFTGLRYNFQAGGFGTLETAKNINCCKDGYVQIPKPQSIYNQSSNLEVSRGSQEGITTPQTPGISIQQADSQTQILSKDQVIETYYRLGVTLSEELANINPKEFPSYLLIYYVTYASPTNLHMLFEMCQALTRSILQQTFNVPSHCQVQLVPIPLDFILGFRSQDNTQSILQNMCLSTYNMFYGIEKVKDSDSSTDTKFLKTFSPSYTLIPQLPKTINFGFQSNEGEFRTEQFYCHMSYSFGPNYEYVMVFWSDSTGTYTDHSVIPLPISDPNLPIPYPLYLHHLWNATQQFVQRSSPINPNLSSITYYICKLGRMNKLELEAWKLFWENQEAMISLISLYGEGQLNLFVNLRDSDDGNANNSLTAKKQPEDTEEVGYTGTRNRHLILLPNHKYPISPDVIPLITGLILDLPVPTILPNQKVRANTNLTNGFTSPNLVVVTDTHLPLPPTHKSFSLQIGLLYCNHQSDADNTPEDILSNFLKQTSDLSYLNIDFFLNRPNFQFDPKWTQSEWNRLEAFVSLIKFGAHKLPYNWYFMVKSTIALLEGGAGMAERYH